MTAIDPKKIFVGGVSWQTNEDRMKGYFMQFGNVEAVELKRDPEDKLNPSVQRHRGFGFVTFDSPDAVAKVLCQPKHILDNKKIDPKAAEIKSPNPRSFQPGMSHAMGGRESDGCEKKLFVGGIGGTTTTEQVKEYFVHVCNARVVEVEFKYDPATQRMRGFGFVTFEEADDVESIIQTRYHEINGKSVEVKKAQPRCATVSGQAYATQQLTQAQSQYAAAYQTYTPQHVADFSQTNGQQYQQTVYSGNQGYFGYGATAATAGYGYGSYDPSAAAYPRSQASSTGSTQDSQSYYQQPYGGQQLPYGPDTSSYNARSAYPPQESYGQQPTGYSRSSGAATQQQTPYPASTGNYGQ